MRAITAALVFGVFLSGAAITTSHAQAPGSLDQPPGVQHEVVTDLNQDVDDVARPLRMLLILTILVPISWLVRATLTDGPLKERLYSPQARLWLRTIVLFSYICAVFWVFWAALT